MRQRFRFIVLGGFLAMALLAGLGIVRYGSPTGFYLRVKAEIIGHMPRDPYVPTPMPTATGQPDTGQPIVHAGPSPTETMSPTVEPSPASEETEPALPTATATLVPIATAVPSPTPAPIYAPDATAVRLSGFAHFWQTWSNCGPATLAMNLSYYGETFGQQDVGRILRPNPEDRRVDIEELADFAREQGYEAITRINGRTDILRLLLSNDIPVITPTWHVDPKGEGMGHFRLIVGYDDAVSEWIIYDSYESRGLDRDAPYQGISMSYEQYAEFWSELNHKYLVIFRPEQRELVEAIIGDDLDDVIMYQRSLDRAEKALEERPDDPFAWVTWATNLVHYGRHQEAADAFDRARTIGLPHRAFWYHYEAFEAYVKAGRLDEALALVDATIRGTSEIEELHYWRGIILRELGDVEGARASFLTAINKRPSFVEPQLALDALGD